MTPDRGRIANPPRKERGGPPVHSLADSAKRNGNLLSSDEVASIVEIAGNEDDLTLRTAASQALGALNIATNKASEIIRSYHEG